MEQMSYRKSLVLKTNFEGDIRRVTFSKEEGFDELVHLLSVLYGEPESGLLYQIRYEDEERDFITVTSNLEWKTVIAQTNGLLRLQITKIKPTISLNYLDSWVDLLSQTKQHISEILPNAEHNTQVLEQVEQIQQKIETCKFVASETAGNMPNILEDKMMDSFVLLPDSTLSTGESMVEAIRATRNSPARFEETIQTPTGPIRIKDVVALLAQDIAKDIVKLSTEVAELINSHESKLINLKDDLLYANELAAKTLQEVSALSTSALAQVHIDAASTLSLVNDNSNRIRDLLNNSTEGRRDKETINRLTSDIMKECATLSSSTTSSVLSDADSIRDLILSL